MKRPTFFISSRSHSADLLASELILTICDQFPKTDAIAVVGKWSAQTRVVAIEQLDSIHSACITLGIEEGLSSLFEKLAENLPQIAILVGYSPLHHALAGFFKSKEVPVILYEVTPQQALKGVSLEEAKDRIQTALSIHKTGSSFIRAAAIPYHYIGTPYRDRVAKVSVKASAFTFLNGKPLITLFPGGYGEALLKMLPVFSRIAEGILNQNDCQIVISLREEADFDQTVLAFKHLLPATSKVVYVLGMHLELLSLSQLVVTGPGAITIESAIALKPFISLYDANDNADERGFYALVNQSLGTSLVPEFSSSGPIAVILSTISEIFSEGPKRSAFIQKLEASAVEFEGSAADNAADFIAQEIGLGKKKPRDGEREREKEKEKEKEARDKDPVTPT